MSLQTPADIPTSRSTRDADKKLAMASAKLTAHFIPAGAAFWGAAQSPCNTQVGCALLVSVFGNTSSSNRNEDGIDCMFGLVRHLSVLDGPFCNLAGSSCASRYEEEWVLLTIAAASEIIDTDKLSPFLSQTHIPGHPSGATQMVDDRGGVQCKRSVYRWRG